MNKLTKENIIINNLYQIYSLYTDLIHNNINLNKLLISSKEDIMNSINTFYSYPEVISLLNKNSKNLSIFKKTLNSINAQLYNINKLIDINNINSLWLIEHNAFATRSFYYLYINNKPIYFNDLYIDTDIQYTEVINNLGFLHKFQYNIINGLYNEYCKQLNIYFDLTPQTLCFSNLKDLLFKTIQYYLNTTTEYIDISIIKKYWLLPYFTNDDELEINKLFSKKLLNQI